MEGTTFEGDRAVLVAAAPVARGLVERVHQVGSGELGPLFGEIDRLEAVLGALKFAVLDQALARRDVKASDATSSAGWVRRWGPSYRAGGAAALVRVAEAVAKPEHKPLAEAVLAGRVPVVNAAVALGEMERRRPARGLPPRRRRRRVGAHDPKAAVVVTMDWADLKALTGAGTTLTGELLAPETVRRMACDAGIIPAVLGSRSEVLDLGRTSRLVAPQLLTALYLRDRGCAFPGLLEATVLV